MLRLLGASLVIASGVVVASCEADSSDESVAAPSPAAAPDVAQNATKTEVMAPSGPAARALRAAFPDHADRVLGVDWPLAFVANEPGFARPPSESTLAHVDVQLPRDASAPMTMTAPGGYEIRVHEIGASGEVTADERAVTYRRAGGTAFWTVTEGGAEEWLHLAPGAVSSMEDVAAAWEVEGATPVAMNGHVALMDNGVARAWITAEEAYGKDGREVDVKLDVRDGRIELHADARGEEVLIDPGWVAVAPVVTGRYGAAAVTLSSGKVLYAAGYTGAALPVGAEQYDPVLNTWASAGNMVAGRIFPAYTKLANGKVLVAGGQTFNGYVGTAEIYDPATNTWTAAASMVAARGITTGVTLNSGKVLVIGGYNGTVFLSSAEVYDPATNTWASGGTMATARGLTAATLLPSGKVLVAGGESGSGAAPTALASAEVYDPATNTWSSAGNMTAGRYATGIAYLSANNKVLVPGGANTVGDALSSVDLYDIATNTWSAGAALSATRATHTTTVVGNGVIVAAGLSGAAGALSLVATSDLYNPANNTWSSGGNLTAARYYASSASVGTGDAIVISGNIGGAVTTSVNRYYSTSLALGAACTFGAQCGSGFCVGGVCCGVAACAAQDQCHVAGTCQAGTGLCSNPNKPDGTICNDNSVCTPTDLCQAGTCTGQNPVMCSALDQCHDAGVCDPVSGVCSNPLKSDGSTCDDGDFCTQTDTCSQGACTGSNPVQCMAADQCHDAGTCDPASGVCSNPNKADGVSCDDGNLCTQSDSCTAGECTGSNPVVCMASDQCHDAGVCDPMTGTCDNPNKADGAACDDGDLCTQTDACSMGVCTGGDPVTCTASDQCHDVGMCDPATGMCDDPEKADGAACDDGNLCTTTDACSTGVCTGTNPITCDEMKECYASGPCNPNLGICESFAKPDGTPCSIGTCQAGECVADGTGGAGGATNAGGTGGSTTTTTTTVTDGGSGSGGESGGCGCRVAGSDSDNKTNPAAFAGLALAALTWIRRRKQSRAA